MAEPLSDHLYLPPLEPCLKGDNVVLSWKLVASALTDPSGHRQSSRAVVNYLTDPLVQSFFTKPGSAFDPPSDKSPHHATFVKKTAAIQVTPTPNDKYDINVIKEDALWLSKNARINEVAALRVVVIEFQSRPQSQLLGPISNQDVANLREAAGVANAQTTNILPGISITSTLDAAEIQANFEKSDNRKRRIFQTYLDECRYYAATNDYIFTLMLQECLPSSPATDASREIRKSFLEAYGMSPKQPQKSPVDTPTKTFHALITQYLNLLPDSISRSQAAIDTVVEDKDLWTEELHELWIQTWLTEALHRMVVVFQLLVLSNDAFVSAQAAQQWFSLVSAFGFLNQLQGFGAAISDLMAPLQCLVCVISLSVINLPRMMAFFEGEVDLNTDDEFLASSSVLEHIHDVLDSTASDSAYAVPVLFAWVPVVHAMFSSYQERAERRDTIQNEKAVENYDSSTQMIPSAGRRNSAGSITTIDKRRYDDFLINKSLDRDYRQIQNLAIAVTDQKRVYDVIADMSSCLGNSSRAIFPASVGSRMRSTFLDVLKVSYPFVGYQAEPVQALLAVLSGGQGYRDLSRPDNTLAQQDVVALALGDDIIVQSYFQQALNRFPYEFVPFLALCRSFYSSKNLAPEHDHDLILRLLQRTPALTFVLPDHFVDYQLANEEENSNGFQFLDDFPLFAALPNRKRVTAEEESFIIPSGTYGRFVADEGRVVRVEYEHSALALLGKRLDVNLIANRYRLPLGELEMEETAEAIALLATLIRVECLRTAASGESSSGTSDTGLNIVAEASRALSRTKDIIPVICDTMDALLDGKPGSQGLATLVTCLDFLHAILPICPGRVWSYMSRCAILGAQDSGGRLAKLVGNLELSGVQLELLMSIVRLFSSLIDSAMASSVRRKTGAKTNPRQKQNSDIWLGVSEKIVTQISLSIVRAAMDILESSSTWKLASVDRMILIGDVIPILDKAVYYTFSMDDINTKTFLMSALEPAAKYVVDSFLASSAGSLRIQPILVTLVAAMQPFGSTIRASRIEAFRVQTEAVLGLARTLVRVANYFDRPSTAIEQQLFKATPFVARVCACHDAFRAPAIELLEALVISAGKSSGEPPSLLGYLGPQISRSFLQLLSMLDKPFDQAREVNRIWRFFSTIVRNRQQWMANCLLTGKTPRDARNGGSKTTETPSNSVLASALERLASIATLEESETLAILDFITSAQNFWPWTIFTLQKNTSFLTELRSFVRNLKPSSLTSKASVQKACNEARMAAYVAEIFAMQLFHLRQIGQASTFANELTRDLDYYLRDGVAVSGYNRGLHVNFARNFSNQYPGCSLDNFKRTLLEPRPLGVDFYYALGFADKMLGFDSGWVGPSNNGFRSEMEKANENLSLVDAQISLYHAWEFLLLELSTCLPSSDTLKKHSLQVAQQCLEANEETQSHDQVFERLAESRVNLALMLVQRVVDSTPSPGDITQLLTALWATVSCVSEPYTAENISLYRTLLKLLYVTLRAQVRSLTQNDGASKRHGSDLAAAAVAQTVLSILDRTVARGFRTLVTLVHDSQTIVSPSDFALLNAILQACLCMPGMDQNQTQVLNIMASHDAVQAAVSLYSWADKLADQGDPIYGELSLLFLLELSALPLVAEQLACDGLLNQITSANLAAYLRRANVKPFAESVGLQRCYSIWAKGIVPLLLNILTALGATIAPEVAYVLNQFPTLMQSSIERFEPPDDSRRRDRGDRDYITLLSVSEIHSLALMTRVLGALRANNARDVPAVEWDAAGLSESVDFWIERRKLLRERLVTLGPREAEWRSMPPASERNKAKGFESRLEEKVIEQLELVKLVLSEGWND